MPELIKYEKSDGILAPGEAHMACVLLLDTSESMSGAPISSLNQTINDFRVQSSIDELVQMKLDIAIIEFNSSARVVQDFTPLSIMQPIILSAGGSKAMGAGIELAIDKVKERNRFYASIGTPYYIPWIIMITGGGPTDEITFARQRILDEESKGKYGKLKFWAIGFPGYSKDTLTSLTNHCIELNDTNFESVFSRLIEYLYSLMFRHIDEYLQFPILPNDALVYNPDW